MTSAVVIGSFAYLCMLLSPEVALADYRQQSTNQSTQLESNAKENLSAVADKLIAVVQDGKESELLEFWSHSGVSFGVDGAAVGKRTLLSQLQQKRDLYCFFFETDCLRKQDEEQRRAAKAPPSVPTSLRQF